MYDFSISKLVLIFIILISNFSKFLVKFQTSWRSIIVTFIISSLIVSHNYPCRGYSFAIIKNDYVFFIEICKFNKVQYHFNFK